MSCCIPGSRGSSNLLKQWKHIWYSSCNWNYDRIKLAIVHCPSPRSICLLHRPDRWAEWGHSGNHQCASFKSLMVALISAVPPGMWYCFWFTVFLGGVVVASVWPFPPSQPSLQQVEEPMWWFCQMLSIFTLIMFTRGLPRWHSAKELTCQCKRYKKCRFNPWVGKIPWKRAWQPTPVFLPGESHGQRSLLDYGP